MSRDTLALVGTFVLTVMAGLAARGESPSAFGDRCIPPRCVAQRSNTPGILAFRALRSGRIARLGATTDFHHGLLAIESATASAVRVGAPLTFNRDIAPIVFDRCAKCHHPGGSAPFSLLTFADVRRRVTLIASVTRSRAMPPWKSEPGYGEFIGQEPLTSEQIDRIQRWIDEGAGEGDPADLPARPRWTDGWQLGVPDLVVTLARPYTLRADGPDDFRAFVVHLPIATPRYVRGLEFRPTNRVVHHADFAFSRARAAGGARMPSTAMGPDLSDVEEPAGQILGWTAGQGDSLLPDGLSWRLDPGRDLVVELHMQPSGKPETVQASIGFYFTDEPPARTPVLLRLGRQDIDIPAGAAEYAITSSYVLPADVEVRAVRPHAHWRAREIRGLATLPDGTTRWLIYLKDWDFRWQHMYRYVAPLALPKGTRVTMRFTYDNSAGNVRNPRQPPARAQWGPQSSDEMGDLWIQMLARDERDVPLLTRGVARVALEASVVGSELLIAKAPADAGLRNVAAFRYLDLDRPGDAVVHFAAAARLHPAVAPAHYNLALALRLSFRADEAIAEYRETLRLKPDLAAAHYSLAQMLHEQGRLDEALAEYLEAVRLDPADARAHSNAGVILLQRDDLEGALSRFRSALALDPQSADGHFNLGVALRRRGQLAEALQHFQRALELEPGWAPALTALTEIRDLIEQRSPRPVVPESR